ncbi:MAG: hypothetical protein IIB65_09950 [Proteobacteria bacterium]|nr:hypothetical protein [Pseudomonadota bacterium]
MSRIAARRIREQVNEARAVTKGQGGLTESQAQALEFIKEYYHANKIPPSYDEMMAGFGLKSKSGVHRLIYALEERGYLRLLPCRARSMRLVA